MSVQGRKTYKSQAPALIFWTKCEAFRREQKLLVSKTEVLYYVPVKIHIYR